MKETVLILYSGGADSVLMLKIALALKKEPLCILYDYGQKHINELDFASTQLIDMGVKWINIKIPYKNINSGLTGDGVNGQYNNVSQYNIPARNSIFLTMAAGIAESKKINEIWIGCDMSDFYGEFPDCKQEYIGKINELFKIAFSFPIVVEAPLLGMKKEMILDLLKNQYEITKDMLYSGYREHA